MAQNVSTEPSHNDTTADRLRYEFIRVQIESLRLQIQDQERRLRVVEDTAVKFNFLLYLTMGGGLVGLINLGLLAFTLLKTLSDVK